jgi:transcriptional regulator with XRE-family HTH domain
MIGPMNNSSGQRDDIPERRVTVSQWVGFNIAAYRKAAGLTQEQLGERLGGWSGASVSAAERSWEGKRVRKFDADELVQIAAALGVPVLALLLPPPDAGTAVRYVFEADSGVPSSLPDLLDLIMPSYTGETPVMAAFLDRIMAIGASRHIRDVDEILGRARSEADSVLTKSRRQAEVITGDARMRAEALEHDAQERHRQFMSSLVQSREELERRVDDLRDFEREYRSRLLAYMESQLQELRGGAADSGVFPPVSRAVTAAVDRDLRVFGDGHGVASA